MISISHFFKVFLVLVSWWPNKQYDYFFTGCDIRLYIAAKKYSLCECLPYLLHCYLYLMLCILLLCNSTCKVDISHLYSLPLLNMTTFYMYPLTRSLHLYKLFQWYVFLFTTALHLSVILIAYVFSISSPSTISQAKKYALELNPLSAMVAIWHHMIS